MTQVHNENRAKKTPLYFRRFWVKAFRHSENKIAKKRYTSVAARVLRVQRIMLGCSHGIGCFLSWLSPVHRKRFGQNVLSYPIPMAYHASAVTWLGVRTRPCFGNAQPCLRCQHSSAWTWRCVFPPELAAWSRCVDAGVDAVDFARRAGDRLPRGPHHALSRPWRSRGCLCSSLPATSFYHALLTPSSTRRRITRP